VQVHRSYLRVFRHPPLLTGALKGRQVVILQAILDSFHDVPHIFNRIQVGRVGRPLRDADVLDEHSLQDAPTKCGVGPECEDRTRSVLEVSSELTHVCWRIVLHKNVVPLWCLVRIVPYAPGLVQDGLAVVQTSKLFPFRDEFRGRRLGNLVVKLLEVTAMQLRDAFARVIPPQYITFKGCAVCIRGTLHLEWTQPFLLLERLRNELLGLFASA